MGNTIRRAPGGLKKLLLGALGLCTLLAAAWGVRWFLQGGLRFERDAQLMICRQAEGGLLLSWPAVEGAERYLVRAEAGGVLLFEGEAEGPSCLLPAAESGGLEVRVQPLRESKRGAARTWRAGALEEAAWPELTAFEAEADPESGSIRFGWAGTEGALFYLYQQDETGAWRQVAARQEDSYSLTVGQTGELPLPAYGESIRFAAGCGRPSGEVVFCSALSEPAAFRRSDFLGSSIELSAEHTGGNVYDLHWNEARGDYYLLQYCTALRPEWADLLRVECSETPGCEVKLPSGSDCRLRVVSLYEGQPAGEGWQAQSDEMELRTALSTLYATVWPVEDLPLYADPSCQETVGTAPAASACCVLEEDGSLFYIRAADGAYGYLDSSLCLINLPDYLGELCAYDITNSYASLYMVHGYEIPEVTGTVITGYEHVRTGEDSCLVPLLYPCARKLVTAAEDALREGYRLKIYDAYRPREATREIYEIAGALLDEPVPDGTFSGEPVDDLPEGIPLYSELQARRAAAAQAGEAAAPDSAAAAAAAPGDELGQENGWLFWQKEEAASSEQAAPPKTPEEAAEQLPAASEPAAPAAPAGEGDAAAEDPAAPPAETAQPPQPEEERYLTYYLLMTNGSYRLSSFLARQGSTHNLGIAMDLTLERADTREELEMQTAMHDLSHYSVLEHNNENAELLAKYMLGAGFAPLSTEWWHFQDDATRDALGLTTYQEKGLSPAGWHRDAAGWYYCLEDGSRVADTELELGGQIYSFNALGYTEDT